MPGGLQSGLCRTFLVVLVLCSAVEQTTFGAVRRTVLLPQSGHLLRGDPAQPNLLRVSTLHLLVAVLCDEIYTASACLCCQWRF